MFSSVKWDVNSNGTYLRGWLCILNEMVHVKLKAQCTCSMLLAITVMIKAITGLQEQERTLLLWIATLIPGGPTL